MKKDFSQSFEQGKIEVLLLVKDARTKRYLVYNRPSTDYYDDDWMSVPHFELDNEAELTRTLVQYLYTLGFVVTNYRELAHQNGIAFSFVDDTPGSEWITICLEVTGSIREGHTLDSEQGEASFVAVNDLSAKSYKEAFMHPVLAQSVALLRQEAKRD